MSRKSWLKMVPTENCDILMTFPGAPGRASFIKCLWWTASLRGRPNSLFRSIVTAMSETRRSQTPSCQPMENYWRCVLTGLYVTICFAFIPVAAVTDGFDPVSESSSELCVFCP